MPDDNDQMTGDYVNGYALRIAAPSDMDNSDQISITVGQIPSVGTIGYVDGTGFHAITGGTLTLAQLQSLYYKPYDGDSTFDPNTGIGLTGADNVTFTYTVSDGTENVTGTINLHTLLGTGGYMDTVQIGDGSTPLTSGHDQVVDYVLTPELASLSDYSQSALQLTTDFHVRSTKDLTSLVEKQVSVTLDVDGQLFTVVGANNGQNDWTQVNATSGTDPLNSDNGAHWFNSVSFTEITANINGSEVTLADYLTSNPQQAGSTWTLIYDDNAGGSEQARYLRGVFVQDVNATDAVHADGSNHVDIIYGSSSSGDIISGGDGNDLIIGREGSDTINGGAGNDTLTGGAGADTFKASSGYDHLTDYSKSEGDKIEIAAGESYSRVLNDNGSAQLVITNGTAEKSITFDTIAYDSLDTSHDAQALLNSLLDKINHN